MTKPIFPVLVLCLLLPCGIYSQTTPSPAPAKLDAATEAALVRLGGQLMFAGKAYEYDRVLADEIGPRIAGSSNYVKAADWAYAEFKRIGMSNVHRESWEIDAIWEPETYGSGRILKPYEQRLHVESDAWSPSTPAGGVRGNVYHLGSLTPEAVKAEAGHIRDAIVLIDEDSAKGLNPILFGKIQEAIALISSEGARALLVGWGQTNNAPAIFGLGALGGKVSLLPVGSIGREDTLLLRRMLERGPVEVEFSFTNRIREHAKVDNIVADIPGAAPSGEFVLIGGHLDGWHLGTAAQDDGTGAATVIAVAEAIEASGIQPRRTLRFVLFGGEELGMLGSNAYVRAHAAELDKCVAVLITDTGSEPPKGWYVFGREDEKQALATIKQLLNPLGAGETTDEGGLTFETDNAAFTAHGVPAFVLWTPLEKYWQLHHTLSDTFDKVNQRDLSLGAAVVGVTALAFADAPSAMKHLTTQEVEEQLKRIKAFDTYQDMQTHKLF